MFIFLILFVFQWNFVYACTNCLSWKVKENTLSVQKSLQQTFSIVVKDLMELHPSTFTSTLEHVSVHGNEEKTHFQFFNPHSKKYIVIIHEDFKDSPEFEGLVKILISKSDFHNFYIASFQLSSITVDVDSVDKSAISDDEIYSSLSCSDLPAPGYAGWYEYPSSYNGCGSQTYNPETQKYEYKKCQECFGKDSTCLEETSIREDKWGRREKWYSYYCSNQPSCYSDDGIVLKNVNGNVKEIMIKEIEVGDEILSMDANGNIVPTKVSAVIYHYGNRANGLINTIRYVVNDADITFVGALRVSDEHMIYSISSNDEVNVQNGFLAVKDNMKTVYDVKIGDNLVIYKEGKIYLGEIVDKKKEKRVKFAHVLTENGNLFVDGALGTMYVKLSEESHSFVLWGTRFVSRILGFLNKWSFTRTISKYIARSITPIFDHVYK